METMETVLDVAGDVLDLTEQAIELSARNNGLHGPYGKDFKYVSEKLSLSLVHQANVVAVKKNGDGTLTVYSGSFTTWSGATDGSTKTYNLSDHLSMCTFQFAILIFCSRTLLKVTSICASSLQLTKSVGDNRVFAAMGRLTASVIATDNLQAKVATYKTLIKQNGLKV